MRQQLSCCRASLHAAYGSVTEMPCMLDLFALRSTSFRNSRLPGIVQIHVLRNLWLRPRVDQWSPDQLSLHFEIFSHSLSQRLHPVALLNMKYRGVLVLCFLVSLMDRLTAAYKIGIGKTDITGPAAEIVMMGFADTNETTAGVLNRLYARAFVIEDPDTNGRIVFVNCDLMSVMQLVQQEVLAQLAAKYNGVYTEQNHLWVCPENFDKIVSGIVDAIDAAHNSMEKGTIRWNKGEVVKGGKNRSPNAYLANPASERALYDGDVDTTMRALHFFNEAGKLRGALAFYPVHPTSLTGKNHLISGDNKGYAEFLLEDELDDVVVGIGISNAADVSPNMIDNGDGTFRGEGNTTIESAEIVGKRQYDTLSALLNGESKLIEGSVVAKLSYVDFSNVTLSNVSLANNDSYANRTCPAVVGLNFAAGTEDGRGTEANVTEGDLRPNEQLVSMGAMLQETPHCEVGQFGIAVTNFETSTMAGRRIRSAMKTVLASAGSRKLSLHPSAMLTRVHDDEGGISHSELRRTCRAANGGLRAITAIVQLCTFAACYLVLDRQCDIGCIRWSPPNERVDLVSSFCDVQKLDSKGSFTTVMTDAHWDLRYHWERYLDTESKSTCEWNIRIGGRTSVAGQYRFVHRGYSKDSLGKLAAYEVACSNQDKRHMLM
ncbi:Neutral/alkaline non-lysosomal ceramidase, C-terminal [Phytophthora cactorum]|nr:Neutral/alkaline non-lysosomal ceramidase, C-terminal [Phytophthora cactorum]